MGNAVSSLVSGFVKVVGDIFGPPLDFISGKSCSSVCGSTWDLICYIENFCVANLLKMVAVLALFYIVLLFFYLLYKIGCCQCICRGTCKMICACLGSFYSSCEYGCMLLWFKLRNSKQMKEEHLRRMDEYDSSSSEDDLKNLSYAHSHRPRSTKFERSLSHRSRERRRMHLERSLKPRSHRVQIGISRHSIYINNKDPKRHHRHDNALLHDNIKVTHTSRFVQKANVRRTRRRKLFS